MVNVIRYEVAGDENMLEDGEITQERYNEIISEKGILIKINNELKYANTCSGLEYSVTGLYIANEEIELIGNDRLEFLNKKLAKKIAKNYITGWY